MKHLYAPHYCGVCGGSGLNGCFDKMSLFDASGTSFISSVISIVTAVAPALKARDVASWVAAAFGPAPRP